MRSAGLKAHLLVCAAVLGCAAHNTGSQGQAVAQNGAPALPAAQTASEQNADPANASCRADVTPALFQELQERVRPAARCYENALRENPDVSGRLVVGLRIAADGTVASSTLAEDSLQNVALGQCVLALFERPFGSLPDGQCTDVRIPLSFKVQGSDSSTPANNASVH